MFESFAALFPAEWRPAVLALTAPLRWLTEWQPALARTMFTDQSTLAIIGISALLLIPMLVVAAGSWSTILSLYTIPFRSGRGQFLTTLLMSWWDAGRCIWLFWAGMIRVIVALVGWFVASVRFILRMLKNFVIGLVRAPFTLAEHGSRQYFRPGMPWVAFLVLMLWSGVEATIFTFTLQPTLNEVFGSLTGFEPNPRVMAPMLWAFLFMLVAGSFACVHVMAEAIREKKVGAIVNMVIVESAVMFFEVVFLYRELIDAITPWIAQQSGGSVQLGIGAVLAFASFGWLGVRGMTWFLFGRFGTPALIAILSRKPSEHDSAAPVPAPQQPDLWRGPINALKAETAWFHEEARRMLELLSLPVLQLLATALNFAMVVVQSRPMFTLPFRSLDDILHPALSANGTAGGRAERKRARAGSGTPHDPMPRIA
jgi:hypothetical protein